MIFRSSRRSVKRGRLPRMSRKLVIGCGYLGRRVADAVETYMTDAGFETGSWMVTTTVWEPDDDPVTGGLSTAAAGDRVRVTVTNSFAILSGNVLPGFQGTVQLSDTVVLRHE